VTRRARLGGPALDHDLTAAVLAATPPHHPWRRRRLAQRTGLVAVALAQLAITVPLLILGHDHDAGMHAAHELGSFDLALAIAFLVGAVRPALSAGLAWPCSIAAASLVGTAIIDLIGGQTIGVDEAQHLVALAGAALLFWQARTTGADAAGSAAAMPRPQAVPRAERAEAADGLGVLPGSADGGDAARIAGPAVAARTAGAGAADSGAADSGAADSGAAAGSGTDAARGGREAVA
jgi:hypothetical protein